MSRYLLPEREIYGNYKPEFIRLTGWQVDLICVAEKDFVSCGVHRVRLFLFYWLPIAFWMSAIFGASGDGASFKHSSRILEPFLHWVLPHLSNEHFILIVTIFRKGAHVTEYAILTALFWRACRASFPPAQRGWHWPNALAALWLSVFYAATDEFHQTFVPSREGCLRDVAIDSCGAVAALILIWAAGRWWKRW